MEIVFNFRDGSTHVERVDGKRAWAIAIAIAASRQGQESCIKVSDRTFTFKKSAVKVTVGGRVSLPLEKEEIDKIINTAVTEYASINNRSAQLAYLRGRHPFNIWRQEPIRRTK